MKLVVAALFAAVFTGTALAQTPDGLSLDAALAWVKGNAVEGGVYTIVLKEAETLAPQTLSYDGKVVNVILEGGSVERRISLGSNGSLFTIEKGVTLTLGANVTLQGRSANTDLLVYVNNGGTFVLKDRAKITSNAYAGDYTSGGGVYVRGTFTMEGGEISGNTASWGGGVEVSEGTFTMNGGEISGNTANYGGGVYVWGTFIMNGGTISGNSATDRGGGVYIDNNAVWTMKGGTIEGNTSRDGGGVFVGGTFAMERGEISGNSVSVWGGGVYVYDGMFTMGDGGIRSNSAGYGGGVYVYRGVFTMEGGEVGGNTAYGGGGAFIGRGTFIKQIGGIIYGPDAGGLLRNTATRGDSYGHVVYASGSPAKKRNGTVGTEAVLDSTSADGWD